MYTQTQRQEIFERPKSGRLYVSETRRNKGTVQFRPTRLICTNTNAFLALDFRLSPSLCPAGPSQNSVSSPFHTTPCASVLFHCSRGSAQTKAGMAVGNEEIGRDARCVEELQPLIRHRSVTHLIIIYTSRHTRRHGASQVESPQHRNSTHNYVCSYAALVVQ